MFSWAKSAFIGAMAVIAMVTLVSPASATIAGMTYTGLQYGPPFGQNAGGHTDQVKADIDTYLGVNDVVYLGRLDSSGFDADAILNATGATLAGTGLGGSSGTWTFTQGSTVYEVIAIEVNAGSKGKIYALTDPALTGVWNTSDLSNKKISHLDFYARAVTRAPEPATFMLFGAGLAGLRLRRRKA